MAFTERTQIGKRQIRLGPDKDEAERRYHALMLDPTDTDHVVADIAERFLDWLKSNRDPKTYGYYAPYVNSFVNEIGFSARVSKIRPISLSTWADANYGKLSDTTRWGAYRSVVRMFNWAKKQGLVKANPVEGVEKPQPNSCEDFISPEQFNVILSKVRDERFRNVLNTLWECGMRPQEVRILEAKHYDAKRGVWILERKNSKGKRRRRVIYVPDRIRPLIEGLNEKHPSGPIFRNQLGKPWTPNAIRCRFRRIADKCGFKAHAYLLRHGFATRKLMDGVDSITVAALMGHSSTEMLEKVYQKATQSDEFMRRGLDGGTIS